MRRFLPFFVCLMCVTAASLLPGGAMPESASLPAGADKGVHILMYLALARLALPALLQTSQWHNYRPILIVLSGIIAYGFALELLQPLLSNRSFEWADILANAAGTLGGTLLWQRKPAAFLPQPTDMQDDKEERH